jgi:hypothetical protein
MLGVEKTPVDKRKPAGSQHDRSPVGLPTGSKDLR